MTITHGLQALGRLDTVSLTELMAVADLQTRRDRKYIVPRSLVDQLITDSHPDTRVLTIDDHRSFRYESVYFDTTDLASYLAPPAADPPASRSAPAATSTPATAPSRSRSATPAAAPSSTATPTTSTSAPSSTTTPGNTSPSSSNQPPSPTASPPP